MIEVLRVNYLDLRITVQDVMAAIEAATCRLMLRMWAEGLYSADGWTIQRIETRGNGLEREDIINLRPYNVRTGKYYQERKNA